VNQGAKETFDELLALVRKRVPKLQFLERVTAEDPEIAAFLQSRDPIVMEHWRSLCEEAAFNLHANTYGVLLEYILPQLAQIDHGAEAVRQYLETVHSLTVEDACQKVRCREIGIDRVGKLGQIGYITSDAKRTIAQLWPQSQNATSAI